MGMKMGMHGGEWVSIMDGWMVDLPKILVMGKVGSGYGFDSGDMSMRGMCC